MGEGDQYNPLPDPGDKKPMVHHQSTRELRQSGKTCTLCFFIDEARRKQLPHEGSDPNKHLDQKPLYCYWYGNQASWDSFPLSKEKISIAFSSTSDVSTGGFDFYLDISTYDNIHEKCESKLGVMGKLSSDGRSKHILREILCHTAVVVI